MSSLLRLSCMSSLLRLDMQSRTVGPKSGLDLSKVSVFGLHMGLDRPLGHTGKLCVANFWVCALQVECCSMWLNVMVMLQHIPDSSSMAPRWVDHLAEGGCRTGVKSPLWKNFRDGQLPAVHLCNTSSCRCLHDVAKACKTTQVHKCLHGPQTWHVPCKKLLTNACCRLASLAGSTWQRASEAAPSQSSGGAWTGGFLRLRMAQSRCRTAAFCNALPKQH